MGENSVEGVDVKEVTTAGEGDEIVSMVIELVVLLSNSSVEQLSSSL